MRHLKLMLVLQFSHSCFKQEEGVEKVFRSADAVYNFTNLVVRFERIVLFANCFHGHPLRNAE